MSPPGRQSPPFLIALMRIVNVINHTRPLATPLSARYCSSFICKLRGLTFRKAMPIDYGLLLAEGTDSRLGSAIHMLGMWFDLVIVWINSVGEVVDVRLARPWTPFLLPVKAARYALEIHPDRINDFLIGEQVRFEDARAA